MAVCLTTIALFLAYAAALPVEFTFFVQLSPQAGFGAGISIFEPRFALKRAMQRAKGEKKHLPWKRAEMDLDHRRVLPAAWHAGRYILKRACIEHLFARGRISTPNAAQTAMLWGCTNMLEGLLFPLIPPERIQFQLQADFSAEESALELGGMVSIRLGHIICAAMICAWHYFARRHKHGKASD